MATAQTAWDDKSFVKAWNDTYGIDMAKAPMRGEFIFPWIRQYAGDLEGKSLLDMGCGNGNLIRHFRSANLARLVGIDPGSAVIKSAQQLEHDHRIKFIKASATKKIPIQRTGEGFDIVTSVFVVEEIPHAQFSKYCANMAAMMRQESQAFVFTNHPVNAMVEDVTSNIKGEPNSKFPNHQGYFDREPNVYTLQVMNGAKGYPIKAEYHHKTLSDIMNAFARAGLRLHSMVEVPRGIKSWADYQVHTPKSGDTPRFAGFVFHKT